MKFISLISSFLTLACCTSVKLTEFKKLPTSEFYKKPVEFKAEVSGAYQISCTIKGKIHYWQDDHWKEINNKFDPAESVTPFFLDGHFYPRTRGWDEGCDLRKCRKADSSISFDLVEYLETGEKSNPQYNSKTEKDVYKSIPKMIPDYKTKFLSGRFKVVYFYYTNLFCDKQVSREFEFEIP